MQTLDTLLHQIGGIINIPLHAQEGRKCLLEVDRTMRIHLEEDFVKQKILILCLLCDIGAGKFRENILREALKANSYLSRSFDFGYLEKTNELAFHTYVDTRIAAESMALYLEKCIVVGKNWISAIQNSQLPNLSRENDNFY